MRNILYVSAGMFLFIMAAAPVAARDLEAGQIVERANLASYYAGQDGMADVEMTITDARGRVRKRDLRILRKDIEEGGEQKFYVYFKEPADVAKMVFMVWKHPGRDDDRWLYLPALDLVRRIASSDKRSSFVGSHFVYEDVSGRSIDADRHELVEAGGSRYKIKNTPKEETGIEFAYYFVWIDKADFLPVKAEYYNANDKLIRVVEATEVAAVQGKPTVIKSVARDLERAGTTTMVFSNVKYDVGLGEDIFAERYLRHAPVRWVK